MSEPIKAGDLVVVVKPQLCGCDYTVGKPFTVPKIVSAWAHGKCSRCGARTFNPGDLVVPNPWGPGHHTELRRLKRIPPLSELEGERRDEKLKEPA